MPGKASLYSTGNLGCWGLLGVKGQFPPCPCVIMGQLRPARARSLAQYHIASHSTSRSDSGSNEAASMWQVMWLFEWELKIMILFSVFSIYHLATILVPQQKTVIYDFSYCNSLCRYVLLRSKTPAL